MTEVEKTQNNGLSYDTKTLITILLLIFVYPIGVIMMFVWMKWPWWVKLLCLLLLILPALIVLSVVGVALAAMLLAINPKGQIAKAQEVKMRNDVGYVLTAVTRYYIENNKMPWGGKVTSNYKTDDMANEKWMGELIDKDYLMPSFKLNNEVKYRLETGAQLDNLKICFDSQVNKGQEVCLPEEGMPKVR